MGQSARGTCDARGEYVVHRTHGVDVSHRLVQVARLPSGFACGGHRLSVSDVGGAQRGYGRFRRALRGHELREADRTAKPDDPEVKTSCKNSPASQRYLFRNVHLEASERLGVSRH